MWCGLPWVPVVLRVAVGVELAMLVLVDVLLRLPVWVAVELAPRVMVEVGVQVGLAAWLLVVVQVASGKPSEATLCSDMEPTEHVPYFNHSCN